MLVFTNREKSEVVLDIVGRDTTDDDKMRRIMSLDFEYRNAEICDMEVDVESGAANAAKQIIDHIG